MIVARYCYTAGIAGGHLHICLVCSCLLTVTIVDVERLSAQQRGNGADGDGGYMPSEPEDFLEQSSSQHGPAHQSSARRQSLLRSSAQAAPGADEVIITANLPGTAAPVDSAGATIAEAEERVHVALEQCGDVVAALQFDQKMQQPSQAARRAVLLQHVNSLFTSATIAGTRLKQRDWR